MLQKWSENWQLYFHPDKCEVLHITHARDLTSYPYELSGCTLQSVTETVDLGVSLTSNLSWNTQTRTVVNKANTYCGFPQKECWSWEQGSLFASVQGLSYTHSGICCPSLVTLFTEEH